MTVNTNIVDLNDYLQHILKSTNMKCLTPEKVGVRSYSGHSGDIQLNFKDNSIFKTLKYDLSIVHVGKNHKFYILPL